MGFLSKSTEPEQEADEAVMEALRAFNRRPKFVDTSAARHKTVVSRLSALLAFERPKITGAVGEPDEEGNLPQRDSIQAGYEKLG